MAVPFPSVEFFETLKERFGDDAVVDAKLDPSEAYCGLAIGDGLYVLEFDGSECAAAQLFPRSGQPRRARGRVPGSCRRRRH